MKPKLPGTPVNRSPLARWIAIIAAGLLAWVFATLKLRAAGPYFIAGDFTWHWRAADALLRGYSPYRVINTMPVYPFSGGYPYFLSTAAVMAPFGLLPARVAMPIFSGLSVAVLAFAFTKDGFWRLPLLLSAPVVWATTTGQLTPLITAAILVPSLGWLAPIKYTIGFAGGAYNLSLRYSVLATGIVLASIVIWPWWPAEWWAELRDVPDRLYYIPILISAGPLLLLALLRWRRPEARLLFVMACVPQSMIYYDQLPLTLLARSYRQALQLAILSYVGPLVAILLHGTSPVERTRLFAENAPVIVATYYLPSLALVLLRPNEGRIPRWLELVANRLPKWARGESCIDTAPV